MSEQAHCSCCADAPSTPAIEKKPVSLLRLFFPSMLSLALLLLGIMLDNFMPQTWFSAWLRLCWYLLAYFPVGFPVLRAAWNSIAKGELFSEFFLMAIATIGAFALQAYPEAVAVMLFYTVGELFQGRAVAKAKANIQSLLDQRPDEVTVLRAGEVLRVPARSVLVGERIQLKPGEKLALDGELCSPLASFNTAALTGESKPETKKQGEPVLAGMINLQSLAEVQVIAVYADSKLSRILELVQQASTQKAPTELFIRKFAKLYTPVVVFLAIGITLLPALFISDYVFRDWLYRALVFLVISCPCALVVSIPLGYFGGIGAASRNGILVKGGNFLDRLAQLDQLVTDKTGTMTEGVFQVQAIQWEVAVDQKELLAWINALESYSAHPVATAIHQYVGSVDRRIVLEEVEEFAGQGMRALVHGKELLLGNVQLMERYGIACDVDWSGMLHTCIAIAYDRRFMGYITIADRIKAEAAPAVQQLKQLGVQVSMLSGDKDAVVQAVAQVIGLSAAYGDLLPEDKVEKVQQFKTKGQQLAFVGDGINDAPVVALSDVGIAMGGLGSDATIETADVVIQDDNPLKLATAIRIGRATKRIVWQNITLAFGVKALVLVLGAGGLANMWEAVFADVGVALLAVLNAIRIQRMKF